LYTGEALAEALPLAEAYPLAEAVAQVADAGAGTMPVFAGEAPLGPAGTSPTVAPAVAPVPVAVFVIKLTWGTVRV
jgi:hypothetical protein